MGGTIPLVSVLGYVSIERGFYTDRHIRIHSLSALDCRCDLARCFKFLPHSEITDYDPK